MGRVVQPATCPACDGEFLPNRSNRLRVATQIYCGNQCGTGSRSMRSTPLAARTVRQIWTGLGGKNYLPAVHPERICEYWACMEPFIPARSDQRFCKRRCKGLDRTEPIFERPCGACGKPFTPKRNRDAVFGSKGCNQRARRASIDGPRRVIKTGIAERDKWMCQIPGCGMPVDRTLRFPAPESASIDHAIPVSLGGTNDPENLRLAHLVCNMRRGVRPL